MSSFVFHQEPGMRRKRVRMCAYALLTFLTLGATLTALETPSVAATTGPSVVAWSDQIIGNHSSNDVTLQYSGLDAYVARFTCTVDYKAQDCSGPDLNVANLAIGPHIFQIRGYDDAGHAGPLFSLRWTVDAAMAPDTRIDQKPADPSDIDVTFAYSSPDASAAGYRCTLDAAPVSCPGTDLSGGHRTFTALIDGAHTFTVAAFDASGLADPTPASYTWVVDHTVGSRAPDTRIDQEPADISGPDVTFAYSSPDASAVGYTCTLDGAPVSCPGKDMTGGETSFSRLTGGFHVFTVAAFDRSGLADPNPAGYSWIVDPARGSAA